jgi:osmotically-inducible protein OsmY
MNLDNLKADPYLAERVRAHLATDARCGELGLVVRVMPGRLFITGSVPTEECRSAIAAVAAEVAGSLQIMNETTVTPAPSPGTDHEVLL